MKSLIEDAGGPNDFYWGVLPKVDMEQLMLKLASENFSDFMSNWKPKFKNSYMISKNRAKSIDRSFENNSNWRVLEIGTGYGQITEVLSRKFGTVDSIDSSRMLLEFTEKRLLDCGCQNVKLWHTPKLEEDFLPKEFFHETIYDLIVVNGVLEWVGSGVEIGNPRDHQKKFLKILRTKLSERGRLYLAIENRGYPKWWIRDPHSKQALTAILPRRFASLYSKFTLGKDYRNYIYSRFGLLKILNESGFEVDFEMLNFYSYRDPKVICHFYDSFELEKDIEGLKNNYLSKKWVWILRSMFKLKLPNLLTPSFTFIVKGRVED